MGIWKDIYQPLTTGSEGGVILKDEEYENKCRVTLEKCKPYYAITCGVYGTMVHTVFCNENAKDMYEQIKTELQEFLDRNPSEEERYAFFDYFTLKF